MGVVKVYRWFYILAVLMGPAASHVIGSMDSGRMFNGLMAIPNLIALVALSGVIVENRRATQTRSRSYRRLVSAG